jgi:hypothetical protein
MGLYAQHASLRFDFKQIRRPSQPSQMMNQVMLIALVMK